MHESNLFLRETRATAKIDASVLALYTTATKIRSKAKVVHDLTAKFTVRSSALGHVRQQYQLTSGIVRTNMKPSKERDKHLMREVEGAKLRTGGPKSAPTLDN